MLELTKRAWNANKETYAWIFDVGRGFSSFVKTPHNYGMMIDCGASDTFKPFEHVIRNKFLPYIDILKGKKRVFPLVQLIVTHPHSDHCTEIESILRHAAPMLLTTPHSNPQEKDLNQHVNWDLVSNPAYGKRWVDTLRDQTNRRNPPLRTYLEDVKIQVPGFDMQIFFIPPRLNEFNLPCGDYANNLSIVVYLRTGENSILFMGDLMPSGCEWLLTNDDKFRKLVRAGITVIVAPHHGLKSGFCQALYDEMPSGQVGSVHLISEKRDAGDMEGETHPKYLSSELAYGYKGRYSYSTKNDGNIRIILGAGDKLSIETSKDIRDLLS